MGLSVATMGRRDHDANDPAERFLPRGKKKTVSFRTRDGTQATKDKIVTKMRACLVCKVIATEEQVRKLGIDLSTPSFPVYQSWVGRYVNLEKAVPACYAVHVTGDLPERVRDDITYQYAGSSTIDEE
ncbi:uncharacterized protein LOC129618378 [Condylostylus longicornis]|uniref:uncharacterized protein LOC129618378 n=1 Tax=Condylostylus longicornis TaxID=2530218 RepID=UPI00244DBF94|nr:uncharacterized protein LOC129618378 [Condylostylus longicornis]